MLKVSVLLVEEIALGEITTVAVATSSGETSLWQSSQEMDGARGNYQPSTLC